MTAGHIAEWASNQATRDRDAYFDLALAIIDDGVANDGYIDTVIAECAHQDYELSRVFAERAVLVARQWGHDKLTARRATFNSFRPAHTLVAQIGTLPGPKPLATIGPVPTLPDGTIDTEAVYEALAELKASTGKAITHRTVLKYVGKPNFDAAEAKTTTTNVAEVAATMSADALADRIGTDAAFRDALIDLVVGIPAATPVKTATKTATGFNALDELKKAETILRRLESIASTDQAVADLLRANRATFKAAVDMLDLTLDGVVAATGAAAP